MSRPYPGAARSLVEQAIKAGWTGTFGPYLEQPAYSVTVNGHRGVWFTARWRLKDGRWQAWYAERHEATSSVVQQVRLDEISAAIKASVTP